MIAVKHLTKRYGSHLAVDDLSFTVEQGEIYGLLGPNGAGKSTTMNIMTGYISATEGTAEIDGCDIFEQPQEARSRIGYLPEQPPLYPDMTPREYLTFVAELKNYDEDDFAALVEKAMATTGVAEVQNRLIRNLSKGYKQRVGLAGALLGEPEVLILDEPTVGLDPKQIIEIRTLIKSLANNHTVLLSSHILSEISAVCDKVLILSRGRLVACDTTENLSKMAEGGNVLCLTVLGSGDAVRTALAEVPHVSKIECAESDEADAVCARLTYAADADIRADVGAALGKAQLTVLNMQVETKTLEDVFLSLTGAPAEDGSERVEPQAEEQAEAQPEKKPFLATLFGKKASHSGAARAEKEKTETRKTALPAEHSAAAVPPNVPEKAATEGKEQEGTK